MATRNRIEIEIASRNDATRGLTQASNQLKQLESTFSKLSSLFVGGMAGSALVSAITGTITKYAALGEELGKLKTATGLSYQQLQMLQRALTEAGTAPEALNTATRILNVNIAQGDKTLAKYGITAKDTYGALMQVGQRLEGMASSTKKSELAMAAFGRSSQDLIDTIGKFATDADMRKGLALVTLSDEEVLKMQSLDERMDKLGRQWEILGKRVAMALEPWAASAMDLMLVTEPSAAYKSRLKMGNLFTLENAGAGGGQMPSGLMWSGGRNDWRPPRVATDDGGGTSPWRPGSFFPGWNEYARRGITGGGASGYNRLLAGSVSDMVPQPLNTFQSGKQASLERTQAALRTFTGGVESAFSGMFSRVFGITSRSNNVIVQLFADLANSVVSAVGQRIGSAIGNFAITALGAAFGVPAAAATSGSVIVNTLESKSLVDAMLTPSGSLRQANARIAQIAAVR